VRFPITSLPPAQQAFSRTPSPRFETDVREWHGIDRLGWADQDLEFIQSLGVSVLILIRRSINACSGLLIKNDWSPTPLWKAHCNPSWIEPQSLPRYAWKLQYIKSPLSPQSLSGLSRSPTKPRVPRKLRPPPEPDE